MQLKYITVHDCVEEFSDDYAAYWYFKQVFDKAEHFTQTDCLELGGGTQNNGITKLTYRSKTGNEIVLCIEGGLPIPELATFELNGSFRNEDFALELKDAFEQYHSIAFRHKLTVLEYNGTCRLDLSPEMTGVFSFNNRALRGRCWEGDALYLDENETQIIGNLCLSTTSFTFRRPIDIQGRPFLHKYLPAAADAISANNGRAIIKSLQGTYQFALSPSSAKSLQEWLDNKAEAIRIVARISDTFLGCYDAYPHPFVEKHKCDDVSKNQLFHYLGECIPVLQEPINWGLQDVTIQIDDETTQISIDTWNYIETNDFICIDCRICEFGFFDDSGYEFEFHYEISYLGEDLPDECGLELNNEKLLHKFKAEKYAYPKTNGSEDFVAENPFGLKEFYRIKWTLSSD